MKGMTIPKLSKRYKELLLEYAQDEKFIEFFNMMIIMYETLRIESNMQGLNFYNNPYEMLMCQISTIQEELNGGEKING